MHAIDGIQRYQKRLLYARSVSNKSELGWMYPHIIRARLALVCRAWYTVLYNEPRVWTTIVILERFLVHPETVDQEIKVRPIARIYSALPDGVGARQFFVNAP